MAGSEPIQRNVYKGVPSRAWLRLQMVAAKGQVQELELLVDTGNPCAIIISADLMNEVRWREASLVDSNFGSMDGGWLRIAIPELEFDEKVLGYGNDKVVSVVKKSDPGFHGLAGLPLLRLFKYGGNDGTFWISALRAT